MDESLSRLTATQTGDAAQIMADLFYPALSRVVKSDEKGTPESRGQVIALVTFNSKPRIVNTASGPATQWSLGWDCPPLV
ncbi:hypothetical protein BDV09DRAFT_169210 [Aspergillus tetrazonus]